MGLLEYEPETKNGHYSHHDTSQMKKRRPRTMRRSSSYSRWSFLNFGWIPTRVVCTDHSHNKKTKHPPGSVVVEWGVILSACTLLLFFLGFYETMAALPNNSVLQQEKLLRRLGQPLNLANPNGITNAPQTNVGLGVAGKAPPSQWPVSLRQEDESKYDTILHPGDNETIMKVPRFWSAPIHQNRLMTRAEAMTIGSCIQSPTAHNHSLGDACPLHQRTIYVGIASYRDFECRSTVESIFLRAQYPERIRVGVVDQIVNGEDALCNAPLVACSIDPDQALCKYADQVDVYEMKAELSIGPVFARHIGYRLYRGEYYATQSDAHVTYTTNWDTDIVSQLESTRNEMAVLSTYLTDVQGSISPEGHSLRNTRPIMCNTVYEGGAQGMHLRHGSQPEREPTIHGVPQLQPWWAAGYSFSRGHFIVNVPYDWLQPMIFQGEEMSIGIRGFTIGYDYYAPERSVCFHHYAVGDNARVRNKVHHFWENDNKYAGTGRSAMKRLLGMVHMNPEDPVDSWDHVEEETYGIGNVRTPENFYETFGIDVHKKTVEGHLCRFVDTGGRMHKDFTPYLRPDGMGIDYSRIHYQFKDPVPEQLPEDES